MTEAVVVVGATSYVGGRLVPRLLDAGHRVIGVSRRPALARAMLGEPSERLQIVALEEAVELCAGTPFAIVNLAYVTFAPPHRRFRADRELARSIETIAAVGCSRLVQISTAAVFGHPPSAGAGPVRVRWRPLESLYAESKLRAEHLIEGVARRAGCELAVVRLGNVIGPGAPAWVARLAQRTLEMQPLAYEGERGFSNATHVDNVADYVVRVLAEPGDALAAAGAYHHLAELSSHRWPELFDVIEEAVGYPWTTVRRPPRGRGTRGRGVLVSGYDSALGGYARAVSGLLPESDRVDRWVAARRGPRPSERGGAGPVGAGDEGLLELLSTAVEFRSATLPDWTPPVDFPSAGAGIAEWLRSSGYGLR